jgi:D-serine deaminase-like pyridoxal phosphate-dependent protein
MARHTRLVEIRSMRTDHLETPAALIDLTRVRRNLETVLAYCRAHGLQWRPHVKTHKSVTFARMQLEAGARGLTVATPREAEAMSAVTDDLLLAHPPVGPKQQRILALPASVRLKVALDSRPLVRELAEQARSAGRSIGVLVELDVGMGRVGVQGSEAAVALASDIAALDGVSFQGVLFYPGHLRVPAWAQDAELSASALRLGQVLDALHRAGLAPTHVSGGSTPTLFRSHEFPGITEIRPGTAIFHDRESAGLGVAGLEDVAYTILATVVSLGVPGQAVVDAGSKALSREEYRGPGVGRTPSEPSEALPPAFLGGGYGVLLDRPDVRVRGVSEEHGILDLSGTDWRPEVGDRVRIIPNHVCVSVNLQDELWASPNGSSETSVHEVERVALEGRGRGRGYGEGPAL